MKKVIYFTKKCLFLFMLFSSAFCFAKTVKISAVGNEAVTVTDYMGASIGTQTSESGIQVSVTAIRDSSQNMIQYVLNIKNTSDKDFYFDENSLSFFQGDYTDNSWRQITYLNATDYLNYKKIEAGVDAALSILEIGLAIFGDAPPPHRNFNSGRNPHEPAIRTPEPKLDRSPHLPPPPAPHTDLFLLDSGFYGLIRAIENGNRIEQLKTRLMFSKMIPSGTSYEGFIYAEEGKGPDYRLNIKLSSEEKLDFVFTRSDKEEILHPWKDKDYARHSIAFSWTLPKEKWGLYYIYSGLPVGAYAGITLPVGGVFDTCFGTINNGSFDTGNIIWSNDIDRSFTYNAVATGKTTYDMTGFCGGLTIKTVPYTWLMLGCGIDIRTDFYEADIYYKNSSGVNKYWTTGWFQDNQTTLYFSPQIGVNMIFDFLDIAGTFEWRINYGPKFNIMFGFAI